MEKEVKLNYERKINLNVDEDSSKKQISEIFRADGIDCANYKFIQGERNVFSATLDIDLESEENKNILIFDININHPLYFAFLHLLNGQEELIIEDEDKKNKDLKYLSIKNEDDLITLNFVDKNKNERLNDRFIISYDNTNSKSLYVLKKNDYKERVNMFFEEATALLLEDSHQINFEEYDIEQKILKKEKERQIS